MINAFRSNPVPMALALALTALLILAWVLWGPLAILP